DAVHHDDGSFPKRATEEGGCGVRLVMATEIDLAGKAGKLLIDLRRDPQFVVHPQGDTALEGTKTAQGILQVRLEQARESLDRLVVVGDRLQIRGPDTRFRQAVVDGLAREALVALFP